MADEYREFKVNRFEYWYLPMINLFTLKGITMKRCYRQALYTWIVDGREVRREYCLREYNLW